MATQTTLTELAPEVAIKPLPSVTHKDCVEAAAAYLSKRCDVVLPEFFSWNAELPDVIGFKRNHSDLVECKVSRADFLKDKKKHFRMFPEQGMGDYRYYCCPRGMISKDELPDGWGLLYLYPSGLVRQLKESRKHDKDWRAEHHLLFYYARRANFSGAHKTVIEYRGYN
jgi:hypothetical protein